MSDESAKNIRQRADESTHEAMRSWHESGELSHLYGQPLHLDDDPHWIVTRALKSQGFSHPLIERRRELDEPRAAAEAVIARLHRRREWRARPDARLSPHDIQQFNESRLLALDTYRSRLQELNSALRDYNLTVPAALHQLPVRIEATVERVAAELPPLEWQPSSHEDSRGRRGWWHRRRKSPGV